MTNNISIVMRGEVPECPPDAICSVGMDNRLVLIILFAFFLGILGGWAMKHVVNKEERKKDIKWSGEPVQDLPEGYHSYSTSCEVYGCDDKHV